MHPMSRDLSPRRKLGPAIFHKTESQDRLIEELQDKLGLDSQEQEEWQSQDAWLTEGVIVTARPRGEEQSVEQQVEKVESRVTRTGKFQHVPLSGQHCVEVQTEFLSILNNTK